MKDGKLGSILLVLSGGVLGAVATVVLIGNAHAQVQPQNQPPRPQEQRQWPPAIVGARYQYQCAIKWDHRYWSDELQAQINARGQQGWRWMGPLTPNVNPDVYCFERAY